MAAPIIRDVNLHRPLNDAATPLQEATVTCWTGRYAQPCSVQAQYRELRFGGGVGPVATTPPTPPGARHELTLGDLTPGAYYQFQLTATDPAVPTDQALSQVYRFTATPGRTPPGPVVTVGAPTNLAPTSVTLNWSTAAPAPAGQANYGTDARLGDVASETGPELRTAHLANLAGLTADQTYFYRIFQVGADGSSTYTGFNSFRTPAA